MWLLCKPLCPLCKMHIIASSCVPMRPRPAGTLLSPSHMPSRRGGAGSDGGWPDFRVAALQAAADADFGGWAEGLWATDDYWALGVPRSRSVAPAGEALGVAMREEEEEGEAADDEDAEEDERAGGEDGIAELADEQEDQDEDEAAERGEDTAQAAAGLEQHTLSAGGGDGFVAVRAAASAATASASAASVSAASASAAAAAATAAPAVVLSRAPFRPSHAAPPPSAAAAAMAVVATCGGGYAQQLSVTVRVFSCRG